ncbi:uncharacterized protein (TIGR02231 family) [Litoreibacter halocynthiae]|uniref:Uncharacterized protein (TIGR02231 family) n=1 Tax=Litoreibacter halocynthiae TaxID=1242689 RepID=A0A4V3EVY1_9RHOB|nr:DUF4139 domain-containing protein [Litoreibacter halocynthiae]TDT73685.1 uncharacterized protein (TIGR02231 family) [Litoreibacter halocynthiae]
MLRSLALSAALLSSAAYAEDFQLVAPVSSVTVYPQGATVTRVIAADLPQGKHRILVPYQAGSSDGPPRVNAPDGFAIGAMEVLNDFLSDPKAAYSPEQTAAFERVEAAKDALQALEDVVVRGQASVEAQNAKNAYLRTLTGAALTGADADAMRAASNMVAEELEKAWRDQYAAAVALRADEKARDEARKVVQQAEQDLNRLAPPSGAVTMLALTVEAAVAGTVEMTLDSLIYNAGWRADYDLNLTRGDDARVAMERKVVMQQSSGELWSDVNLTLSTANPFAQVDPTKPYPSQAFIQAKGKAGYGSVRTAAPQADYAELSRAGGLAEPIMEEAVPVTAAAVIDGLSVTYEYPQPVNLASGGGELILALDDFTFDAREFNRAAPRFDKTAFLMAEFTNSTQEPFLPGQMSVSRDGVFVGRSALPLVPAGDKAEVSFGTLEGLRLDYKLLDNDTGDRGFLTSSSTRVQQMEFSVENLLATTEQVQTIFALPYAEQEDLSITTSSRPSPDETDFEQKRGVSVWNLDVGPGETKTVRVNVDMDWPEGQQLFWQP